MTKNEQDINHLTENRNKLLKIIKVLEAERAPNNIINLRKQEELAFSNKIKTLRKKQFFYNLSIYNLFLLVYNKIKSLMRYLHLKINSNG